MGLVNYGNQSKSIELNADGADYSFNSRNLGIVPVGIYSGGLIKILSTSSFKITPMLVEMLDGSGSFQVRLQTLSDITLAPNVSNPYVILNWQYSQVLGQNYADIILTNSLATYPNAIVIGKCVFTGSNLTSIVYFEQSGGVLSWQRTTPNDPKMKFKLEFDSDLTTRDVYLFPGMVPNISGTNITGTVAMGFQKLNVGTNGNLIVYINRSQAPGYSAPTLASSYPVGTAFVVFAELNGVPVSPNPLTLSMYRDVRHFIW